MNKKERDYCQKEVMEMLGVKRATIYRWRRKGLMPDAYDEGPNILYWDRAVFDEWMRNRKTRRLRRVGACIPQSPRDEASVTATD